MGDGGVQTEIVSEREMPLRSVLHDDEPALGPDLDRDAMSGAVLLYGIHECALAVKHLKKPFSYRKRGWHARAEMPSRQFIACKAPISAS